MKQCKMLFKDNTRFLMPCLLLILSEEESHGYGLLERIEASEYYDHNPDISVIYRNLGKLEQHELVEFRWETQEHGPAKKVYSITEAGKEALRERVEFMKKRRDSIDKFIKSYDKRREQ